MVNLRGFLRYRLREYFSYPPSFCFVLRHTICRAGLMDRRRWVVGPSDWSPFPCLATFCTKCAGFRGVCAPPCMFLAPNLRPSIGPCFRLIGGYGGCPKWRCWLPRLQLPPHGRALARLVALLATGVARGLGSAFTPLPLVVYLVILHVGVSVVDSVETIIHRCLGSKSSF